MLRDVLRARKKIIALVLFALLAISAGFFFAAPVSAQTAEQLVELQRLINLVTELQRQLAILEGGTPTSSVTPAYGANCPALAFQTLSVGVNNQGVYEIQRFLTST